MMGNKQKLKSGIEYDVIYDRGLYCYLVNRPHLIKWTKRQLSKRRRREAKQTLKKEVQNIFQEQ